MAKKQNVIRTMPLQVKKEKKPSNRFMCFECGDIVQSKYRHNFVSCKCGASFVDGGDEYMRCGGSPIFVGDRNGLELAQMRREWAACKKEGHRIMTGMRVTLRDGIMGMPGEQSAQITQVFKNGKVRVRTDTHVWTEMQGKWITKSVILNRNDIIGDK